LSICIGYFTFWHLTRFAFSKIIILQYSDAEWLSMHRLLWSISILNSGKMCVFWNMSFKYRTIFFKCYIRHKQILSVVKLSWHIINENANITLSSAYLKRWFLKYLYIYIYVCVCVCIHTHIYINKISFKTYLKPYLRIRSSQSVTIGK